jgi:valyl-tRNA synthetase
MDTWATSSLTPQIATGWIDDDDLFQRTFPMNLRPQGPEIIRTWLFATVVRSHFEHGSLPWSDTTINGWVLDPDRKKMSKSKGNVVTPMPLLEEFGADAIRYWACRGAPGTDTAADKNVMKVGRRLAMKVLNASRFALSLATSVEGEVTEPLDQAVLTRLAGVVDDATAALEGYDYTRALDGVESFFWDFCDNYLELVKGRAYGSKGDQAAASAHRALTAALSVLQRLFAPVLSFVTEEVWSWWQEGSVHRSPWPDATQLQAIAGGGDADLLDVAAAMLTAVRRAKTEAKQSMKAPVAVVTVTGPAAAIRAAALVEADVAEAGNVERIELVEGGEELTVDVRLAG